LRENAFREALGREPTIRFLRYLKNDFIHCL
jgi:hypothetical protein